MKKIVESVAICSVIMAAGCQNERVMETVKDSGEFRLEVKVGKDSRTFSSEDGRDGYWGDNEVIWVSSIDGSVTGELRLISRNGSTATFGGNVTGDPEKLKYTIYPVPKENKVTMGGIEGKNHNAPMYGAIENGGANFNYAGGLIRLVVDGTENLKIKATNGDGKVVTGGHYTYTVDSEGGVSMTFIPAGEGFATITLPNKNKTVVFVPVAITEPENADDDKDEKELTVQVTTVDKDGREVSVELSEPIKIEKGYVSSTGVPNITVEEDGSIIEIKTVASWEELVAAVENRNVDGITLAGNIALEDILEIDRDFVLDLGANVLQGGEDLKTAIKVTAGEFTLKNGGLEVYGEGIHIDGMDKENAIVVNVEENTGIVSENDCCIYVKGTSEVHTYANVTVNTAGHLESSSGSYSAVQANGFTKNLTLNVNGGRIISHSNAAIYFPCTTNLTISDGSVEGYSAVYQKSGNLSISGERTQLIGFGEKRNYEYNSNGCTETGDALIIESCDYPGGTPNISITGGNFISKYGSNIGSYAEGECIPVTGFVHGGHFSDPTGAYHMAADADIDIHLEKNYEGPGFKTLKNSGQKVRLGFNPGVVYTVTAPLVGSAGTETLGFQFNTGTEVTIEGDGTITSEVAKMLVNNYSNLTMRGVTLAPTAIPDMKKKNSAELQPYYVLSNNCGEVNLGGVTITAPGTDVVGQKVFAMDVCKYSTYPTVHVHVENNSVINGNIEYTGEGENQSLTISDSTINGNLIVEVDKTEAAKSAIHLSNTTVTGSGWNILDEE